MQLAGRRLSTSRPPSTSQPIKLGRLGNIVPCPRVLIVASKGLSCFDARRQTGSPMNQRTVYSFPPQPWLPQSTAISLVPSHIPHRTFNVSCRRQPREGEGRDKQQEREEWKSNVLVAAAAWNAGQASPRSRVPGGTRSQNGTGGPVSSSVVPGVSNREAGGRFSYSGKRD